MNNELAARENAPSAFMKYCAIDTNVVVSASFGFQRGSLEKLLTIAEEREVMILLTSVFEREIEQKFEQSIQEATAAAESFRKNARILRQAGEADPLVHVGDKAIASAVRKLRDDHAAFLGHARVRRVDVDGEDLSEVLDWYFAGKPPFGPGKKKAEFPDAFSMSALSRFARKKKTIVTVISSDDDVKRYCEQDRHLQYVSRLDEFFESILIEAHDEIVQLRRALISREDELRDVALKAAQTIPYEVDYDALLDVTSDFAELSGFSLYMGSFRVVGVDADFVYATCVGVATVIGEIEFIVDEDAPESVREDNGYGDEVTAEFRENEPATVRFTIRRTSIQDDKKLSFESCVVNDDEPIYVFADPE